MNHENEENEDTGSHDQRENQDNRDTLSDLPDCLLIHILSFLNAKDAVQTCILSSRWEHLWKHLKFTALTLHSNDFKTVKSFMEFATWILSLRDISTPLNALDFECPGRVEPHILQRIYPALHNVKCLRLSFSYDYGLAYDYGRFLPSFLSSCHSLTSLDIGSEYHVMKFPNSLNLPTLTYLKLHLFSFYTGSDGRVEPFSTFKRLNTLILSCCTAQDRQQPICISSTTLLNLSLNLNFIFHGSGVSNIELFAPSLCTFALTCNNFPKLSGSHLSSIEQVSIDAQDGVGMPHGRDRLDLLSFLIELTNIKSLTVTPATLRVLSLVPGIFKLKLTCLCNLKSLILELDSDRFHVMTYRRDVKLEMTYRRDVKLEIADGKSWKENAKLRETIKAGLYPKYSSILDRMIEFLLQNSPSAKFDILFES